MSLDLKGADINELLKLGISTNQMSIGATIVGVTVGAVMTGIGIVLAWDIYSNTRASRFKKSYAISMASMGVVLTVLEAALLYRGALGIVKGPNFLPHFIEWPLPITIWIYLLAAMASQAYFTHSCYVMWRRKSLVVTAIILMLVQSFLSVSATIRFADWQTYGIQKRGTSSLISIFFWIGLVASVTLDLGLFAFMYIGLKRMQRATVFKNTQGHISFLLRTMFESYFLVAIGVVAMVSEQSIAYVNASPHAQLLSAAGSYATAAIMTRLYLLSFLIGIRRRESRSQRSESEGHLSSTKLDSSNMTSSLPTSPMRQQILNPIHHVQTLHIGIGMDRSTDYYIDDSNVTNSTSPSQPQWSNLNTNNMITDPEQDKIQAHVTRWENVQGKPTT